MNNRLSGTNTLLMQSEIFVTIMVVVVILFMISVINLITAKNALNEIKNKEQPPLIILDEAQSYTFKTGSGELSTHFGSALKNNIIPYLEKMSVEYNCDVIEVYGYTDGQAYRRRKSNRSQMDALLLTHLENNQFPNLSATSNLELGMLRAASIVHFLKEYQSQSDTHLQRIRIIRPYSGGQLILPNGEIASASNKNPDALRRRIELRLSRTQELHDRDIHLGEPSQKN